MTMSVRGGYRPRLEIPDRPCACGCEGLIAGRYPNGKPTYARYLRGHHPGTPLTTLQRQVLSEAGQRNFVARYPDGKRTCPKCEGTFDLEVFFFSGKWREICQPCHKAGSRRRWAMLTYGVTEEEYDALVMVDACAVCGAPPEESEKGILFFDHDHRTGKMREPLCSGCNKGLGSFQDDPERLRAAADYIEKHRELAG